jgi:DNA repair protein RecN (Recombination protein N)
VGRLMRELGKQAQIVCITHLPQVAALGHIHFKVEKKQSKLSTTTSIIPLDNNQRIQELARLLGGINISEEAMAHAKSLLEEIHIS